MNKAHAAIISIALGVAAVAGTFAAVQTTSGGAEAAPVVSVSRSGDLAARKAQLDRLEARIARAAKKRPPALPALPAAGSVAGSQSRSSGAPSADGSYENEQEYEDEHEHEDEHAAENEHEDEDHGDDD